MAKKKEVETTDKRKVKKHHLPTDYNGRCSGDVAFVSGFPTFGGKLAKDLVLHKFEMRLPIPAVASEEFNAACKELFNFSGAQMIGKALEKMKTDLDEGFKKVLFEGISNPEEAELATPEQHVLAQAWVDEWRYTPPKKAESISIKDAVAKLRAAGKIPADISTEGWTFEDLIDYMG